MVPARNVPALVSPLCPVGLGHFVLQLQSNRTSDIISLWGLFNNTFLFIVSVPLPLPFALPVLSRLLFPLAILWSHPFPGPCVTALCVMFTLAVVIFTAIARTAPSTARLSVSRPVLIIIILVNSLIPIQWSNCHEISWFILPAASRLNL